MIALIIKSYFSILLSIGIASLLVFLLGLLLLWKLFSTASAKKPNANEIKPGPAEPAVLQPVLDVSAIAGEDEFATQLDLARAYVEAGKNNLAKNILEGVLLAGNPDQQNEARSLLNLC